MRMIVALLAALIAGAVLIGPSVGPSSAQKMGNQKPKDDAAPKKKSNEDKDYKAAVDRLPDQKFDPWRNMR
jgi:hypothetical protein